MSKYYWERGDSAVAYIDTAGKLSARLQTSCANVNHKKYTFYGLQKLYSTAEELCDLCHLVNRMIPGRLRSGWLLYREPEQNWTTSSTS